MSNVVELQPKQIEMLQLMRKHRAVVVGVGGGRGAAKSSGADRVLLHLMYEHKTLACMVMRNFDQVYKYHIEPMRRDYPWLDDSIKTSMPASLKIGRSQLDFSYAENMDDIIRRFRSGNYDYIVIDQAEQFSGREIREIRKACRSRGAGGRVAKIMLLFNMRGAGIHDLRKWFHLRQFNKDEDAEDYVFLKINPWDNVEWVRGALERDGYTINDYYLWTDEQRKAYAAKHGPYTKQLATDDEAIRAADWEGSWDSIEGAYFSNSFDLESCRIDPPTAKALMRPWSVLWMSQDWGKSHWCVTYWHLRVALPAHDVPKYLPWLKPRTKPLNVICTYREMVTNERTSEETGKLMVECTPPAERTQIRAVFGSPEEVTGDPNCVGSQIGRELRMGNICGMSKADNERIGGWALMDKLLKATKWLGCDPEGNEVDDIWLISSDCPSLLEAIPMAMRDPKNIDDVLKTDKSAAKLEQDALDAARYGLKTMIAPRQKSAEDQYREQVVAAEPAERMRMMFRHEMAARAKASKYQQMPPSWKGKL